MADYTLAQLTSLRSALASGATTVQFENRTVTYRSLDEIKEIISIIEGDLGIGGPGGSSTPIRHIRVYTSKGT